MSYIEIKELNTWREYVQLHENSENSNYIFRGQSNAIDGRGKFIEWRLDSSFNRAYTQPNAFSFDHIIRQHLQKELFNLSFGNYKYEAVKPFGIATYFRKMLFPPTLWSFSNLLN